MLPLQVWGSQPYLSFPKADERPAVSLLGFHCRCVYSGSPSASTPMWPARGLVFMPSTTSWKHKQRLKRTIKVLERQTELSVYLGESVHLPHANTLGSPNTLSCHFSFKEATPSIFYRKELWWQMLKNSIFFLEELKLQQLRWTRWWTGGAGAGKACSNSAVSSAVRARTAEPNHRLNLVPGIRHANVFLLQGLKLYCLAWFLILTSAFKSVETSMNLGGSFSFK